MLGLYDGDVLMMLRAEGSFLRHFPMTEKILHKFKAEKMANPHHNRQLKVVYQTHAEQERIMSTIRVNFSHLMHKACPKEYPPLKNHYENLRK